jgi:hypothetical protein
MQYLIPKEGFNISFIEYFLRGVDFEKHRSGSTIPHVYFFNCFFLIPIMSLFNTPKSFIGKNVTKSVSFNFSLASFLEGLIKQTLFRVSSSQSSPFSSKNRNC